MRPFAADPAAFDAFTRQWFFEVVVPEYRLHDAEKSARGRSLGGDASGSRTPGSGTMPVEVAAVARRAVRQGRLALSRVSRGADDVTLGKGEARDVVISCPFEPERIVVDPDAKVLQLQRKNAGEVLTSGGVPVGRWPSLPARHAQDSGVTRTW